MLQGFYDFVTVVANTSLLNDLRHFVAILGGFT